MPKASNVGCHNNEWVWFDGRLSHHDMSRAGFINDRATTRWDQEMAKWGRLGMKKDYRIQVTHTIVLDSVATGCQVTMIGCVRRIDIFKSGGRATTPKRGRFGGRVGRVCDCQSVQQSGRHQVFRTDDRQVRTREVPRCSPGKQPCSSKRSKSDFSNLGTVCGIACYLVDAVDR